MTTENSKKINNATNEYLEKQKSHAYSGCTLANLAA